MEIKVAVITIQNSGIGHNLYFVLAGQPQSINMVLDFNIRVTSVVSRLCKKEGTASLVSVAADGVGCDAYFIQGQLVSFLLGKAIGESCVMIMGKYVLNPALLSLAGVAEELWLIKDWALELVVLMLGSVDTAAKLAMMVNEAFGSVSTLCITLYFMKLKLFAVNTKKAYYFGLVIVMARDDVMKPMYLTTGCSKHTFGGWRAGHPVTGESVGPVNVSSNSDTAAVEFLWVEVKSIINDVSEKMEALLGRFGIPRDAGVDMDSKNEKDLEEDDMPTVSSSSGSRSDEADAGDNDKPAESIDTILFGGYGENGSTVAARKFCFLLVESTMDDLVMALKEGMQCLQLKHNERGSTTGDQMFQSLVGHWYVKGDQTPGSIEYGSVILGCYNMWYIANKKDKKQLWMPDIGSGKYILLARMIHYDQSAGLWYDREPDIVVWGTTSIYILVGASDINDVLGKIILKWSKAEAAPLGLLRIRLSIS
eukprot:15337926-Ditylum_brightwellii.AAC.1